jgi:dihydroflavonol-4-reductase
MVLVTGGTGLVGSHVIMELLRRGQTVRALHRKGADLEKLKKVFRYYGPDTESMYSRIEWFEGDIKDIFSLEDALDGVTKVYHCAALVSFNPDDRDQMIKVNAEGTANVVNACLDAHVKKLCHVSSTAAIGRKKDTGIIDENTQWKNTPENSWYAISKYNAEREVWRGIEEGLNAVIVNPSVVLGPSDWNLGSSTIFRTAHKGLRYYTEGGNAFVDVRDVARAMVMLTESEIHSERFLVTGENLKFKDLFEMIAEKMGKKKPSIKVSPFLSGLAWRWEKWTSWIFRRAPRITKESARAAHASYEYDHSKIKNTIGITFTPIKETIEHCAGFYNLKI